MKIEIDSKPFAVDYHYSGTIEVDDIIQEFTIVNAEEGTYIVWEDHPPFIDITQVEAEILKQYNNMPI